MSEVVIVSATRTCIGSFGGGLSAYSAIDLGATVIQEAIKRADIDASTPEEVIMGQVLQAGLGQNPVRQAAIKAGLPIETPSYGINKLCGSGLKTVCLAAQAIHAGDAHCLIAGGMESMSNSPYVLEKARFGIRMGNEVCLDSMVNDGLIDAFSQEHMGITAENLATRFSLSRESQDAFALASQNKAIAAIDTGAFRKEICPVVIKGPKGDTIVEQDEYPRRGVTPESLAKLRPAFKKEGTVTAGNASGINDGAAALVIASAEFARSHGLKPLARIVAYASAGVEPSIMGIGPVYSTRLALQKARWTISDVDYIEANEAFAAQSLSVVQELGCNMDKVNIHGGAIALGHPIGASGARILVTLLHVLEAKKATTGLATLCVGGGQGVSMLIERL